MANLQGMMKIISIKNIANDVYEIKASDGKTYLMPKIDEIVKEINVYEEYILIEPMKGLFDED